VEIVPTVALPRLTVFTCHVTAEFDVFETVALNCCVPPPSTLAVVDVTEIETGAGGTEPPPPFPPPPQAIKLRTNPASISLFIGTSDRHMGNPLHVAAH
jgi:hypothetical protein